MTAGGPAEQDPGLQRCKRCRQLFKPGDASQCWYHPGRFEEINVKKGVNIGWTCCRFKDAEGRVFAAPRSEAFDRHARGCVLGSRGHIVDPVHASIVKHFPATAVVQQRPVRVGDEVILNRDNAQPVVSLCSSAHAAAEPVVSLRTSTPTGGTAGRPEPELVDGLTAEQRATLIKIDVHVLDTLPGIALRYDTTVEKLLRINRLADRKEIYERKHIYVPKSSGIQNEIPVEYDRTNSLSSRISQFRAIAKVSVEEAKYYLEDADGNLATALHAWRQDFEWQKRNLPTKSLSKVMQPPSVKKRSRVCF